MISASSCVLGDFEQQLQTVLHRITLPEERLRDSSQMISDLERAMRMRWPGSSVIQFGATMTGLALNSSDIDCFLSMPKMQIDDKILILQVQSELKRNSKFTNIHLDANIYCPVLSFVHVPTRMTVDLTVSRPIVLQSSSLLAYLLNLDKRILPLAIIIKYWSYVHNIAGEKHILSYYAMTELVIFYFQQKNMLPSVASIQNNAEPYVMDNWNTAFLPSKHRTKNNQSLYELLGDFFEYYSDFNFDDVISPYCACVIKAYSIVNLQELPRVLFSYENNVKMGLAAVFKLGPLNIQDVIELSSNSGKPWNSKSMADNLIYHLKIAAKMYKKLDSDRFLLTILKPQNKTRDVLNTLVTEKERILESCLEQSVLETQ